MGDFINIIKTLKWMIEAKNIKCEEIRECLDKGDEEGEDGVGVGVDEYLEVGHHDDGSKYLHAKDMHANASDHHLLLIVGVYL